MKTILSAILAALVLLACGGGGDAALAADPVALAQRAGVAAGPALIAEGILLVNSTTAGDQVLKTVGAVPDGGYTVAWLSGGALYLQRYDSAGIRLGGETAIQLSIAAENQAILAAAIDSARLAVLGDGSVVVAYRVARSTVQASGSVVLSQAVYLQRFDASGAPVQGETQVSPALPLVASRSPFIGDLRIAALADGGFVIGWTVATFAAQFGFISTLSLQRFDSQGRPVGAVAGLGPFPTLNFSLTADAAGGYTVVASYVDPSFNPLVSVVHFHADSTSTPILSGSPGALALLLPLTDRYLLFVSGPAGSYQQVLDIQGSPIGQRIPIASMPVAAAELADGSYVLVWAENGALTVRRFDRADSPVDRSFTVRTGGAAPQIVALAQGGFALAWSAPGAGGDADVFTERFPQVLDARKKACLDRARGMKGQQRKAFVQGCLA